MVFRFRAALLLFCLASSAVAGSATLQALRADLASGSLKPVLARQALVSIPDKLLARWVQDIPIEQFAITGFNQNRARFAARVRLHFVDGRVGFLRLEGEPGPDYRLTGWYDYSSGLELSELIAYGDQFNHGQGKAFLTMLHKRPDAPELATLAADHPVLQALWFAQCSGKPCEEQALAAQAVTDKPALWQLERLWTLISRITVKSARRFVVPSAMIPIYGGWKGSRRCFSSDVNGCRQTWHGPGTGTRHIACWPTWRCNVIWRQGRAGRSFSISFPLLWGLTPCPPPSGIITSSRAPRYPLFTNPGLCRETIDMRVSDLARKTGTTTETVRHYTDIGLLQPVRDPNNGYRRYGNTDLRLLRFALKARSLGFTLADIQSLAEASRHGETPCGQVRTLIETRLQQVEDRIAELQSLSQRMRTAMAEWQTVPDQRLDDGRVCGLIDTFTDDAGETG